MGEAAAALIGGHDSRRSFPFPFPFPERLGNGNGNGNGNEGSLDARPSAIESRGR